MHNIITHSLALLKLKNTQKKKSKFLVLDQSSFWISNIDRLKVSRSIEKSSGSSIDSRSLLDRSSFMNFEFPKFLTRQFSTFFMNKQPLYEHDRHRLLSKLNSIDAIALNFNLTYLNSNLHHNINISFHQIIVSTIMQKIKYV